MESEFPLELQSETFKVLSSNDDTAMETLFTNLYNNNNQHHQNQNRSKSLTFLQCCKHHHPDLLMIKLFYLLTSSPQIPTRTNAARALNFINPAHLWPKLRPQAQSRLQAHFIKYLTSETSIQVLRLASLILSQTISVIYQNQNHHQHWKEILDFLFSSVNSNDEKLLEFSLLVFASLSQDCRLNLSKYLNDAVKVLHSSFLSSLANSTNPNVQVASFGAVVNLIQFFSEPSLFHELLRAMMVAVFSLLHGYEKSYFKTAFGELIKLVSAEPGLLKPYMSDMVLDSLQIAENNGVSDETRRLAFELVMAMTELKECDQMMMNLPYETVVRLFIVPVKTLVLSVEDKFDKEEKGKGVTDGENEKVVDDDDDVYEFGIKCLKKLCVSFEERKVVDVCYELLMKHYLDSADWKMRHAGITLLTVIAKEISDEMVLMENFLGEIVTKILKLFQDSHVQVRLAAFTLMEMPINFVQAAQILYHHRFVHAFTIALGSDQDNKVKEQVASAMLFFLKNTLPDSLALFPNVDTLMNKLLSMIKDKGNAKQRSIALSTFNLVAQRCHEVVHKYFANYLLILLEACSDRSSEIKEEAARGIRICAELGSPSFKPFINMILSELSNLMKDPSRSISENAKACDVAVSAIGRICECHRDSIDRSLIVPVWLSFLPLKDDLVEAKIMHDQLCLMVGRLDKDLLGPGNQNLVKIITVFLEVIEKGDKLATTQTINHINNLLRQFGQNIPPSVFETILLSLNPQQRELLLPFVSSF
ncbi:importin-5-like [Trifolium pratense]|uniref:importin-5-like n=1 Tax=Trifolium pratense TaxID=57577 RepID=UPI001E6913AE|nr:importin-5-like [Trifolium pratense]